MSVSPCKIRGAIATPRIESSSPRSLSRLEPRGSGQSLPPSTVKREPSTESLDEMGDDEETSSSEEQVSGDDETGEEEDMENMEEYEEMDDDEDDDYVEHEEMDDDDDEEHPSLVVDVNVKH